MDFGIDDINRPIIMAGHKAIIQPRDLDFSGFPDSVTFQESGGVMQVTHYKNWDAGFLGTGNSRAIVTNSNNKRISIGFWGSSYQDKTHFYLMSSKNIKGALLNFGLSYGSELGVSSLYIKVELVKPDGTVLATPYSNTYSTSYNYDRGTWGLFSFNSWWDNNVCYVNKMGHQINTEQFYLYDSFADYDTNWDNYITTTSYQLLDNDVRLRIYFYADTRDDNYSDVYIHAYLSSVSFG